MKKIIVLMSTYNGEKYIEQQIDSILNQEKVDLELLVRDDGSTDSTKDILERYKKQGKLKWYTGSNLRSAKSFLNLLKECGNADYYAFADQDDFWHKEKLYKAIEKLEEENYKYGKLYISSLNVVDSELNYKFSEKIPKTVNFETEMIKNYATGCTMVFDKNLRKKINDNNFSFVAMHDSLICRVASMLDCPIICDNESYIDYRQHGNNVLGMTNNPIKTWKRRWKRFVNSESESSKTAQELLNIKRLKISDEKKDFLIQLANYKTNKKYKRILLKKKIFTKKDKLVRTLYKIKLLFNKV